jgi:putative FmdB family regulatory protein
MPLYEYECDACGRRFERIQKFSDPPVEKCPSCDGNVRKLLSSPAIQFKGSGWYITDYAKKGGAATSDSAKSDADKASTDGGGAADKAAAPGASADKTDKAADKPAASPSTKSE